MTKQVPLRWLALGFAAGIVACGLLCLGGVAVVEIAPSASTWLESRNSLKSGSPAPDFTLKTLDGRTVWLSQFRGQPLTLTFAASWCPDCRAEAPTLQLLHAQHPELPVLLVDSGEPEETVRGFARDFGMTHPVLLDRNGKVSDQYHIYAIPTTFFIDAQGIIRGLMVGGITPSVLAEYLPRISVEP